MGDATQVRTVIVSGNSSKALEGTSSTIPVAQVPDEITPEIVAVVQAAANEFFGRQVRIVSIRILPPPSEDSSVWLRRGRDTIQASHNLVQQRH
jgi:hypothetical protein